jgi:hypothetical protein
MSRLWACDRCGITTPADDPGALLPANWKAVAVRALPEIYRDVCPGCVADLDKALQDWFRDGGGSDPLETARESVSCRSVDYDIEPGNADRE